MTRYTDAAWDAAIVAIRRQVLETSAVWAADVQDRLRSNAAWVDRNGPSVTGRNARQSLECEAGTDELGNVVIVARADRETLRSWQSFSGAPVSLFLELGTRFMTRRDIIRPTIEGQAPALIATLNAALGGSP